MTPYNQEDLSKLDDTIDNDPTYEAAMQVHIKMIECPSNDTPMVMARMMDHIASQLRKGNQNGFLEYQNQTIGMWSMGYTELEIDFAY